MTWPSRIADSLTSLSVLWHTSDNVGVVGPICQGLRAGDLGRAGVGARVAGGCVGVGSGGAGGAGAVRTAAGGSGALGWSNGPAECARCLSRERLRFLLRTSRETGSRTLY